MRVVVRLAEASDADAIVAFGSAVIPAHYTPILGAAVARRQLAWWNLERIESAIAAGRIVVAVADDDIAGVAETGELGGEQVIWKLYLVPDLRGRSLGVELLHRAIQDLPAGTDHVLVEHVAGNAEAGKFYEREGFAVVRTEPARSGNPDGAIVWRRLELSGAGVGRGPRVLSSAPGDGCADADGARDRP
jgi:ribosomal protein S18 acetylase RimI-like enzyme